MENFCNGKSRAAVVPEILNKIKICSSEQITVSSLSLIFLLHDFETTNYRTVAVGKIEFSKIDSFLTFSFCIVIILWELSRHTL